MGYNYNGDWNHTWMLGEMIATDYDDRKILINNVGLKGPAPVILFGNQTHYILGKSEVIELNRERLSVLNKAP